MHVIDDFQDSNPLTQADIIQSLKFESAQQALNRFNRLQGWFKIGAVSYSAYSKPLLLAVEEYYF